MAQPLGILLKHMLSGAHSSSHDTSVAEQAICITIILNLECTEKLHWRPRLHNFNFLTNSRHCLRHLLLVTTHTGVFTGRSCPKLQNHFFAIGRLKTLISLAFSQNCAVLWPNRKSVIMWLASGRYHFPCLLSLPIQRILYFPHKLKWNWSQISNTHLHALHIGL